jgi:hypothetical protein
MNPNRDDRHICEVEHGGGMSSGAGSTDDRWAWLKHGKKIRLEEYGLDPETLENILSISVIDVQDEYDKIKEKIAEKMSEYDKENPIPRLDFKSTDPYWHSPEGRRKRDEIRPLRNRRDQFESSLLDDLLDGINSPLYGERVHDDDGELQRIIGNFGHIPLALPVTPLPTEHEQLVGSEISTLPVPPDFMRRRIHKGPWNYADDLTVQLQSILGMNNRLRAQIDAGAPQMIIDDLQELLTYHVSVYLDNESEDYPPGRARSGRALVTVAQRIRHQNSSPFSEAYGVDYMRGIPDN